MTADGLANAGSRQHRLLQLGPIIVVLTLVAALWTLIVWGAMTLHKRTLNDAQQQLRLINNGVLQQTRGLLQGIEADLLVIDHWVRSHPDTDPRQDEALGELISRLDQSSAGLVSLAFVSSSGRAIAMPRTAPWLAGMPPIDGLAGVGDVSAIGAPVRSAPDQPWRWPVSRRLTREAGDIVGVVAWVDLARLSALHEAQRDKPAWAITLSRSDGTLILRTPIIDDLIGRPLTRNGPLSVQPASAPRGTFTYDGRLTDRQARLVTYERLGNYPVTVLVSQGIDEVMATFVWRRNIVFGACGLITLLAFGFSVMLLRSRSATRRTQAELAAVNASFPLGLFRTDPSGETIYANDAYFQKLGLPRERLAWGWSEIVEESQRSSVAQNWREAVSQGLPVRSTLDIRRPDSGEGAVLSVRTAPLHVDGRLAGQVGSLEDITERIQQQQAQRMLTAIFEQSTDLVAQLDRAGGLMYLNPAGRARLGLGPNDSLAGLRYDDFTPAHRELQVRDEIMPVARKNGVWVGETSVLAGGRELQVSEMLIVHRDENRRIETISIVMRDITQELRSRMELQRSESILRIVASSLPASMAVFDEQQRYLFTNAAFDRLMGRPDGALVGSTMLEALGEADYQRRRPHVEAALAGERTMFASERTLEGRQLFLETTYIPFRNADGRVAGFVGLAQDVTAHRLQQQKLLDASQTDALTGVLNRAGFNQRMHEAMARAHSEQHLLALLCLDLDSFKPVNDQHGHAAGDALLSAVAQRLQGILRPSDLLARLGGDEFAVVLPEVKDEAAARAVAQKIVSTLAEVFQIDGGRQVGIGGSVGLALAVNGKGSVQGLMQRADEALYRAKRSGRGRYEVAGAVTTG